MTEKINMDKAERIAYADTKHLNRPRWSELSVFYLHGAPADGKRWLALSVGMSSIDGETTITDRLHSFGLESALELFDDNTIGRKVKSEARDWRDHHEQQNGDAGHPVAPAGDAPADPEPFTGSDDEAALAWLFGPGVSNRAVGEALGVGESTLRAQIKGNGVRVPLLRLVPFINRAKFRESVAQEGAAAGD